MNEQNGASQPLTWEYVARELRAEADCRGDLDERTVGALVAHSERLERGWVEGNLARHERQHPTPNAPSEKDS